MPRIIEDAKKMILAEAKRQVLENGYSNMTIRSVAKECGIGNGTIYNYYASKDVLVASFMLEDWMSMLQGVQNKCSTLTEAEEVFTVIYTNLTEYMERYAVLFSDSAALRSADGVYKERHKQLRTQISDILRSTSMKSRKLDSDFLPDFAAEALLAWAAEKKEFAEIYMILKELY